MSAPRDPRQVRQWLEAQIAELGKLRNASTRDPGFKQWRQHTLTLIQRSWTDDPGRATRFKRIPFTAPGTKPSGEQVKQAYDRGCAEALTCLRGLLEQLDPPARPPAAKAAGGGAPPSKPEPTGPPLAPGLRPQPGIRVSSPAPSSGLEIDARQMRDLPRDPRREPARESTASEPEREDAIEPAAEAELPAVTDILSTSPVFAALERIERDREPETPSPASPSSVSLRSSPTALALAALAAELESLGVPAAERDALRSALDGLAKRIDRHELDWEELREAVAVVMGSRVVARRVIPLVLPFLDEAA